MSIRASDLLQAARAEHIPAAWYGLWFIKKIRVETDTLVDRVNGRKVIVPAGIYTHLFRVTESTLHLNPPGTVVMEDTPCELRTHLSFMLRARGRVLVTGLGLGCVVRGLLANPAVEHVTCIEKSGDVLKLVKPYMPQTERLTIIHADAFEWAAENKEPFDYAWHDLWSDRDSGEPHLDIFHTQLIYNCRETVKHQGAWNYPRVARRLLEQAGLRLI